MKKHDEGYALALVLVVLTVLCIVALSMMSVSLSNVTRQQATLQRMQEKYDAQGEIEKVVARLENRLLSSNVTGIINIAGADIDFLCRNLKAEYGDDLTLIEDVDGDGVNDPGKEKLTFTLTTTISDNRTQISCTIRITGAKIQWREQGPYYEITAPAIEYDIYSIEETSEGGEGA